jgi:hypothetical protein
MPKKLILAHDCHVTTIHAITGQEIEEGTLDKGALIRKAHVGSDEYGMTLTTFECSTDDGKHWYKCTSMEPVCTCVAGCELSCQGCPHCEWVAAGGEREAYIPE